MMPRSRDISRYAEEYWELLDAVAGGAVVDIPFETRKEALSFRSRWYAFTIGVASALRMNCRGLDAALADRVRQVQGVYGLVAVMETESGLRFIHKSMTAEAQRIQAALRRARLAPVMAEPTDELMEASAAALFDRMVARAPAVPAVPAATSPTEATEATEDGPPLGGKNPYY